MIEALSLGFAILFGVVSWLYAHRAHKNSVQAPILKLSFCDPETKQELPSPSDGRTGIVIVLSPSEYNRRKKTIGKDEILGFSIPVIVKNSGTKTAHNIKIHCRYSPAFIVHSLGKKIPDGERPNWIVIEHSVPDIHPKQSFLLREDILSPHDFLINGLKVATPVTTKDKVTLDVEMKLTMNAYIEIAAFSEDSEPIFRVARTDFSDQKAEQGATANP